LSFLREWELEDEKNVYLIRFGGPEEVPPAKWTVIGRISYPQGVAF